MKLREVIREAWRNVTTGTAYALTLAATTVVLTTGCIWLEASEGFAQLVGAPERPGLVVEKTATDRLGAGPGSYLPTSSGPLPVSATFEYPDDGRDPLLVGTALNISPANGS